MHTCPRCHHILPIGVSKCHNCQSPIATQYAIEGVGSNDTPAVLPDSVTSTPSDTIAAIDSEVVASTFIDSSIDALSATYETAPSFVEESISVASDTVSSFSSE